MWWGLHQANHDSDSAEGGGWLTGMWWCMFHCLRLIANAAGGLLPALAVELRQTFNQATVLPSYGMTEWYDNNDSVLHTKAIS
jgi:hypothetical protein